MHRFARNFFQILLPGGHGVLRLVCPVGPFTAVDARRERRLAQHLQRFPRVCNDGQLLAVGAPGDSGRDRCARCACPCPDTEIRSCPSSSISCRSPNRNPRRPACRWRPFASAPANADRQRGIGDAAFPAMVVTTGMFNTSASSVSSCHASGQYHSTTRDQHGPLGARQQGDGALHIRSHGRDSAGRRCEETRARHKSPARS